MNDPSIVRVILRLCNIVNHTEFGAELIRLKDPVMV
jgi:hypothetical protein